MLNPKKSLGQNFLLDKNICKKISNLTNFTNKIIIEIGSGTGQLTDALILKKPKKLILIEVDKILYKLLIKKYKDFKNIYIYNDDALKFKYENFNEVYIISNLPYNISVKIIINLLTKYNNIKKMYFMIQKEVALKMTLNNKKKLNKYSFFINYVATLKTLFNITNKVFYPRPKIQSTVIEIKPKIKINNKNLLWQFSKKIFSNKRKKIRNVIKTKDNHIKDNLLSKRAEDLSINEILKLFNNF